MSDREFMKSFSSLIVALVGLTVVLFIVAQMVGGKSKSPEIVAADTKAVAERIKPIGEVSVGTNSVMDAIIPSANAAGADKGKTTYDASCAACHTTGVAGAPKLGDKSAWVYASVTAALLIGIELFGVTEQAIPFIYFQF